MVVVADISDETAGWIGGSILGLILIAFVLLIVWGVRMRRRNDR